VKGFGCRAERAGLCWADEAIQAPHGKEVFLETQHSEPFTPNSVGNRFRDQCKDAGANRIAPVVTLTLL
jgi:hypothetical protein